jgi:PAS domain S-box-containing protein
MHEARSADPTSAHLVGFYESDEQLVGALVRFLGAGLGAGESVVAAATRAHLRAFERQLTSHGLDLARVRAAGRYAAFDAEETLAELLRGDELDFQQLRARVLPVLDRAQEAGARVRVAGEMVALLWRDTKPDLAIQLEAFWADLAAERSLRVLCTYPLAGFTGAGGRLAIERICDLHSEALLADGSAALIGPAERGAIGQLQERASQLEQALQQTRATAESLSRLAAIVECSDDAIIGKTVDGIVTSWNQAAERIFGYTAEEMIGQPIQRIIPPDRPDDFAAILGAIRRGERVDHYETERLHKDGRRIRVSLSVSPIRDQDGRITGCAKIARDVTVRRQLEGQREHLLGVAQRARAEAEAASRSKDEFLAILSHELRNPLAALRNAIYSARLDASRRDRALEIAGRQIDQLGRLVDDLLDLARITHGQVRLNKQRVSLAEVVERSIDTARPLITQRGHVVSVSTPSEPVCVVGDPARLEQLVGNLLANAARYTNPGGRIELSVECQEREAVLRVRDNGIGIAPEMLPRIFDLFAQARAEHEGAPGGLGIGLAIVRDLVALHGGRVDAHSEGPGRGAEFVVSLPCLEETPQAESQAASAEPLAGRGGLRVLVVEDNLDAAEGLMMLLEVFGHETRVAHDGPSALEAARADRPDLMLVDIGLPGIDGYEIARRVRSAPELCDLPLVALTGFGHEEDRRRAFEAGFDHHLTKPVDPARLRQLVAGFADAR